MGCSAETVKAIEVGRRALTLTMAVRAARALGIKDLSALYGADVSYAVVERPTHAALPDVRTALLMQRIENGEVHPVPYIGAVPETSPRRPPGFIEPALELV